MIILYEDVIFRFFFNDTATTEIYTLSLHDALPISAQRAQRRVGQAREGSALAAMAHPVRGEEVVRDRKSTRLNSSHSQISYAVFCLKKKSGELRHADENGAGGVHKQG